MESNREKSKAYWRENLKYLIILIDDMVHRFFRSGDFI